MDKKELYKSSLIIFAVAMAVVLVAPAIGSSFANFYLRSFPDGMDTVDYLYVKERTMQTCQIIGGITAFLSGLQAVLVRVFCYDGADSAAEGADNEENK